MLSILDGLYVHWAKTENPELVEMVMLTAFGESVADQARSRLFDPAHPLPFANLEGPGGRKQHGIQGVTGHG